jgi:selenocysteine lyase/cysteine desulfurase
LEDAVTRWRDEFPSAADAIHFNHAGVAPVSRRVADAVTAFIADARDHGPLHYAAWEARAEAVRAAAAQAIAASPDEVAFVASTSDGLSTIATGLEWRAGESVVCAAGEFPANVYPWWGLEPLGVTTRMVATPGGRLTVEGVRDAIDTTTRVVSISAVDFASGQRRALADIAALCRARDIIFCVDAIQALGALELDAERDGIDCLAADGHKWLCAPEGCGVLYVSRRCVDRIAPRRLGWKSVRDHGTYVPYHFELKANALKYEPGSLNFLSIHALGAAFDLLLDVGVHAMERQVLAVTDRLREALAAAGFPILSPEEPGERSGITTVEVRRPPLDVVTALRDRGVLASARGGGVRLAPHFYASDDDVARAVRALAAVDREG